MAFYIRYYENETLLSEAEEIEPYLVSLNCLSPKELEIVHKKLDTLRSGTNRIYLDGAKKKYLLVIGTNQTNIEDFHKNSKSVQPEVDPYDAWNIYYLDYMIQDQEECIPCCFKAKIRHCELEEAYTVMADFLKEKYVDAELIIPPFSSEVIRVESC